MSNLFSQAFKIVLKTTPFVVLRLTVYGLFALAALAYYFVVYFTGHAVHPLHDNARGIVWFLGIFLSFPLVAFFREYVLYVCKAAHVAVIAELVVNGKLPEGESQINWGRSQVKKFFAESSGLFLLDRLMAGVITSINGVMGTVGGLFEKIPGVGIIFRMLQLLMHLSLTYVDEAILARQFLNPNETIWKNAENGLILYAQSWREILKTAVILGLVVMVTFPLLFAAFLLPALGVAQFYPNLQVGAWVFAGLLALVIKAAFVDPFTLTTMILVYLQTTANRSPDPAWQQKLASVSKKFRKIQERAVAV